MDVANVWMTGSGNKAEISSIKHRQVIADSVSPQHRQDPDFMDRQVRLCCWLFPSLCWQVKVALTPCHSFPPWLEVAGHGQAIYHGDKWQFCSVFTLPALDQKYQSINNLWLTAFSSVSSIIFVMDAQERLSEITMNCETIFIRV